MEVKIGVVYTPHEMVIETDDDVDTIASAIDGAFGNGDSLLWLTDTKGRRVGVPTDKIAYVEVGSDVGDRHVGFGVR
jgi:Protein of unknown function (DUF3107)